MNLVLIITSTISDAEPEETLYGPHLPTRFIRIVHHPHSHCPSVIIPLDSVSSSSNSTFEPCLPASSTKPYAPFRNLADFEFTENAVLNLLPPKSVDTILHGIHNGWSRAGSRLTIRNHKDMEQSARICVITLRVRSPAGN